MVWTSGGTTIKLLKNRTVILFFIGIFAYVGLEQGVANWISVFLKRYHGLSPETDGAQAVAWFWGLMTVGCAIGLVLLKLFDAVTPFQVVKARHCPILMPF